MNSHSQTLSGQPTLQHNHARYDPLSRLATALTTGSTAYPQWGLSWNYDGFGNRTAQNLTAGSGYSGSVSVNSLTNQITTSPYAYDANGNMTNDATNTLVYDAENRATSATNSSSSGAYTYDGNGLRVKKAGSTTTVYIFSGGKVIAEYDNGAAVGSPSREYIYGGAVLLAKIAGSTTTYYHQDHLSNRLLTSSTGSTVGQMGTYPFGDPWYNTTNDKLFFTTYERDSESGNDYAMARYYVWRIGRFLSLDPMAGSTSDPQALNRYSYVENNPIGFADPSGMMETEACDDEDDGCSGGGGGGGGFGGDPGTGSLDTGDAGFSQAINSSPCLAGCGYTNRYGAALGGVQVINLVTTWTLFLADGMAPVAEGGYFTVSDYSYGGDPINNAGLGGGARGGDPRQQAIEGARSVLYDALSKDPDCLGFLSGRGIGPLGVLGNIPINHDYIGGMSIQAQTNGALPNPYSLIPQNPSITINDNGWFFTRGGVGTNGTNSGTQRFQGSILLHELGHATGVLLYDGGGPNALASQAINAEAINNHCQKTLASLSDH